MDYIERAVGFFPISVGTSLALEGLFNIHPNRPSMPSGHRRITHVWVNLRTMIRNFYDAMSAEEVKKAPLSSVVAMVMDEIQTIYGIFQQPDHRHFQVTIYCNSLETLQTDYPHANFKKAKTERQVLYETLNATVLKHVLDLVEEQKIPVLPIRHNQCPTFNHVVAMVTHYPHELLWRFQFDTLFLLESHTGKLKPYTQWFTKLHGIKPEDHIPFNRLTMQLFGDKTVFEPFPKKLLDEIHQLAVIRNWNVVTSVEKLKDNIREYGGEQLKKLCYDLA